eukprot:CAMPEP_0197526530 /NCGR_PEP_ID=MMETSP1318-20131121/18058_1 /TAXON_ID=552666 /ORGANISM="Partenskyella glossopodia, Strain RCC365" /LENGTH=341 /DNA_ID=CAMNT_0043080717 /DNA_START=102 /DNA_END=1127 /DNA_ORIENTATION=-
MTQKLSVNSGASSIQSSYQTSKEGGGSDGRFGWTTASMNASAPMSLILGQKLHLDNGQGGYWTAMKSPKPVPPPSPIVATKAKTMYGGSREAAHVGGFLQNDTQSYEPRIWEFMVHVMGVKSLLDIGCGRGISTKWFHDNGCRVRCAEATNEGIETTVLPSRDLITQHDFTQGPWWPRETFDAVWSVEFLEHVHEDYMDNWFATMRSAHYVFTSHSKWGGHHHVAIHHDWWWIEKFESRGFAYAPEITDMVRRMSMGNGHYMRESALVFRNTRNVRIKPMYGPGTGGQHCDETKKKLWGTQLLKQACDRNSWAKGQNPIIPWVAKCRTLCEGIHEMPIKVF